jgi:beta-glucosidase
MKKNESVATMFAAGIDMFMIPSRDSMLDYIASVKMGLQNNTITLDRLNDAVARIIAVKISLGIAEVSSTIHKEKLEFKQVPHSTSEYQDSLNAVHESLVLLKNNGTIPVQASSLEYIVLVGEKIIEINQLAKHEMFLNYDNIGMQSGGWSARWQGFEGNSIWQGENKKNSNASSILDGLKNLNQKFNLVYPNYTTFTDTTKISIER